MVERTRTSDMWKLVTFPQGSRPKNWREKRHSHLMIWHRWSSHDDLKQLHQNWWLKEASLLIMIVAASWDYSYPFAYCDKSGILIRHEHSKQRASPRRTLRLGTNSTKKLKTLEDIPLWPFSGQDEFAKDGRVGVMGMQWRKVYQPKLTTTLRRSVV